METFRDQRDRDAARYDGATRKTVEIEEWAYLRRLVREGFGTFVKGRFVARQEN
jgi:hypothetical protein